MAQVKLIDASSNEASVYVDSYEEEDVDNDIYQKSTDGSLKTYTIGHKKRFVLQFNNLDASDKDLLKTIYDTRSLISFYRNADDGSATASCIWRGGFNLHTPTNSSHIFIDKIYAGSITLEEV